MSNFFEDANVSVGIPRGRFIIHPDPFRCVDVCLTLFQDEWWLVHPELIHCHTIDNVYEGDVYEGIDGNGAYFVLPVVNPLGCKSEWYESLYESLDQARYRWVVVEEDIRHARFNLRPSPRVFPNSVQWHEHPIEDLLMAAFKDRYIDTWRDNSVAFLNAVDIYPPPLRPDRQERMLSILHPRWTKPRLTVVAAGTPLPAA